MSEKIIERVPESGVRWHPYAELFPWIEGSAYEELKADIAKNGVLEPVVFLGDSILDGRNRYMAARSLGLSYPRTEYEGDDPLGFVLSKNLNRRHLDESQRAMVAAKLAKLPVGANQHEGGSANFPTQEQAAKQLNVSDRSLRTAKHVREHGAPELVHAVEAGEVSVSAAAEVAGLPKDEQTKIVAQGSAAVKEAAKQSRQARGKKPVDEEWEKQRQAAADALPQSIKDHQAAKTAAIAGRKERPVNIEALIAENQELREANAALEVDVAALKADNKKFEAMRVQFEMGGFDKVIEGKDAEIAALLTRVERESQEKVKNLRSADYWKRKAVEHGYSRDVTIDLGSGEVVNG